MITYATVLSLVKSRVMDAAEKLSEVDYHRAIRKALGDYTRDRPRVLSVEVSGSGAFDYATSGWGAAGTSSTAATQWEPGFSSLLQVVYPYSVTSRAFPVLDEDDYGIVDLPAGPTLRFAGLTPSAGQTALVLYTRRHELGEVYGTVPEADVEALADLAASYAFRSLAAYYAQATDSTFGADVADHTGRSAQYLALSREHRESYDVHVGRAGRSGDGSFSASAKSSVPAAGIITDWDRSFDYGYGGDYLFHSRRRT